MLPCKSNLLSLLADKKYSVYFWFFEDVPFRIFRWLTLHQFYTFWFWMVFHVEIRFPSNSETLKLTRCLTQQETFLIYKSLGVQSVWGISGSVEQPASWAAARPSLVGGRQVASPVVFIWRCQTDVSINLLFVICLFVFWLVLFCELFFFVILLYTLMVCLHSAVSLCICFILCFMLCWFVLLCYSDWLVLFWFVLFCLLWEFAVSCCGVVTGKDLHYVCMVEDM